MSNRTLSVDDLPRAPVPRKRGDWVKVTQLRITLNDRVEEIHNRLIDNPKYIDLLDAVYDAQAIEGSLAADNLMAAAMIRQEAQNVGSPVQREKLAIIAKALNVVLRRYELDRRSRRNMVEGQVPHAYATQAEESSDEAKED